MASNTMFRLLSFFTFITINYQQTQNVKNTLHCVPQLWATSSPTRQSPTSDNIRFLSLLRRPGMNCRTLCEIFGQ